MVERELVRLNYHTGTYSSSVSSFQNNISNTTREVETPIFMPVGTKGTIKGLTSQQMESLDCKILLANTYHLGAQPGPAVLDKMGGLHKFMNWKRNILTDSGGFQMVSLFDLADITEEGVKFRNPDDGSMMMLTPEKSVELQNKIGADILMALDDVNSSVCWEWLYGFQRCG